MAGAARTNTPVALWRNSTTITKLTMRESLAALGYVTGDVIENQVQVHIVIDTFKL